VNPPHAAGTFPRIPELQDWARLISLEPTLYFRPQTTEQLKQFLSGGVGGQGRPDRVRVLGSLHSCSNICLSGTILDVNRVPRTIEYDSDFSAVTFSSNWRLHDLLEALASHGKALPATGGTDEQTLAGLISTNTAPATPARAMYQQLEWVEYLAWDAASNSVVERRLTRGEPGFSAAVCSLGLIGVLTRVRFGLIDQPYFRTVQRIASLDEMLSDVEATSRKYDFWRIDWVPDTDKGLVWTAESIPRDQADPNGDYKVDQAEGVLKFVFTHYDKIHNVGPLQDPILKGVYALMTLFYGTTEATGPMRTMLPVDRRAPLRVAMAEWSFDPQDLDMVLARCREYFEAAGWPNLPIEIELSKTDDYFMSPWNWAGLPYIVKFNFMYLTDVCTNAEERAAIYTHLQGLWNFLLAKGVRFKAHWGKINFMDPEFVRKNFQLDRFRPYIQPMFMNDYLAERLGP
jgi:hypothetical protein